MLTKEKTVPFTIRPPESVSNRLLLMADELGSTRAELAANIIKIALNNLEQFQKITEQQ